MSGFWTGTPLTPLEAVPAGIFPVPPAGAVDATRPARRSPIRPSVSVAVSGIAARSPPPPRRDDCARASAESGQFALSATTWQHSISAVFLAARRCAFMSPSR